LDAAPTEPAIEDYALIGDTRTAALCSSGGSIDWLCVPRFDSEPIFGRILGGETAGCFSISVAGPHGTSRRYRDGSAILETTWRTNSGVVRLTEGMVLDVSGSLRPQALLVRRVTCVGGRASISVRFDPRLGLPGRLPRSKRRHGALVCTWESLAVALQTSPDSELVPGVEKTLELNEGSTLTFVVTLADRAPLVLVAPDAAWRLLDETHAWWKAWSSDVVYEGPFREDVVRSLVTLRLLTYSPSGAPVAAPTTSLPELIGGRRNWDYRFAWPRDASIGIAAFLGVGKREEAHSFMHWLLHASRLTRPRMEVLYTIFGKPGPREQELENVHGYRDSRPVRIGNAASSQHQLDVYGWVLDAAWLLSRSGMLHGETWRVMSGFADFVAAHWREPDAGIWEVRGARAHYVHSKLMGWLALDRACRIATTHKTRKLRVVHWSRQRDELARQIRLNGFDPGRGAYVWAYGSSELDAALLLLPVLEFEVPGSPRLETTVTAIQIGLRANGALLYRYRPGADGLEGQEGAFLPCSFWLAQALARLGRVDQAVEILGEVLATSNDVRLLPEEIDPATRAHLGNFPQAFSHAAMVQAALAIQAATRNDVPASR
jgi:GH15 family glucan-1,4-alpha-glucosidase